MKSILYNKYLLKGCGSKQNLAPNQPNYFRMSSTRKRPRRDRAEAIEGIECRDRIDTVSPQLMAKTRNQKQQTKSTLVLNKKRKNEEMKHSMPQTKNEVNSTQNLKHVRNNRKRGHKGINENIILEDEPGSKMSERNNRNTTSEGMDDVIKKKVKETPVADLLLKAKRLEEAGVRKRKYVGAQFSISGGLCNAIIEAVDHGARAFSLFLRNQRQWTCKPLVKQDAESFKTLMKEYQFSPSLVIPHGSYLMNCGSPNKELLDKSRSMLIDELQRCEMLGLELFNFHPGSTCGKITREECICLIAESINMALKQTKHVTAVIENMSCQGNTVGGKFSELSAIIDKVKDKSRIGVCLDTCHLFAAGYDIATEEGYEKVMKEFDDVVGFKYLKAIHLNDSKGKLGCHLDQHANIGLGCIGMKAFKCLMNDEHMDDIPLILETPMHVSDREEIQILNKLID